MANKSITEIMTDFAVELKYEDIPPDVVEYGKMLLLDAFGVSIAAKDLEHARAVKNAILQMKTSPQCTLWFSEDKAQLADAILYNSTLIHGLDFDDTHVGGIVHPSSVVVSTALSVGEYMGATGKEILEAIIAGWEIMVRLGLAAKGKFHDLGYHATGVVGPFAAACVAGKLMKISKKNIVNALGICGSQAAALQEFLHDGTWVKKIHPGWAGHSSIYSLFLAKNGFTAPRLVMEGEFGLWKTHLGTTDGLEEEFSDLGTIWRTKEITFKMYQTCHFTHTFTDLVLDIMKKNQLLADDIERIECRIDGRGSRIVCEPRKSKYRPETEYAMRFSLPYVMAISAIKGKMTSKELDISLAKDPRVIDMIDRVDCVVDESVSNPGHFPGWVKITLKDGRTYQKEQQYELGTTENPIAMENIVEKFFNNMEGILSRKKVKEIMKSIMNFETLESAAVLIEKMLP